MTRCAYFALVFQLKKKIQMPDNVMAPAKRK